MHTGELLAQPSLQTDSSLLGGLGQSHDITRSEAALRGKKQLGSQASQQGCKPPVAAQSHRSDPACNTEQVLLPSHSVLILCPGVFAPEY